MSQILNDLLREHGDELIAQLASALDLEKAKAEELVTKGVPVVMSGLRQQKKQVEGGEDLLAQAGQALGGGDLLGQLGSIFGGGGTAAASPGQMNDLLGGVTDKMATAIARKTGIAKSMVQQALVYLVPIVIAALFKFGQQAKAAGSAQGAPQAGNNPLGGLGAILDRDGDGSILDDILEMAGGTGEQDRPPQQEEAPPTRRSSKKIVRAPQSQSQQGGGLLGGILKGILGGGKKGQ